MNDAGFIVAVKNIASILKDMWEFCTNAWEIINNPIEKIILPAIDMSYWFLLITAIICFILTMAGCKKTQNGAMISTITYLILKCIGVVLASL